MPRGKTRLTPRQQRREFAETAPGAVRVRLAGDTFASDVLVQILRDHPSVEIMTGPDRYDGDRQYLMVRVRTDREAGR